MPATLARLAGVGLNDVIVVDGGSTDRTADVAAASGARVLDSPRGRGVQLNRGAAEASGDILLFLHADSLVPDRAGALIRETLARPGTAAGAFRLKIDTRRPLLKAINLLAEFRSRSFGLPYGDQGLFLTREVFTNVGGFPDWPLMEDLEIVRRLKKMGRVSIAPACMTTSARRWEAGGVLATCLRGQLRLLRYYAGRPVETLARDYDDVR